MSAVSTIIQTASAFRSASDKIGTISVAGMNRRSANQIYFSNAPPHVARCEGERPGDVRILPQPRDFR